MKTDHHTPLLPFSLLTLALIHSPSSQRCYSFKEPSCPPTPFLVLFDVRPCLTPLDPFKPQLIMPFAPEYHMFPCFWDLALPAPAVPSFLDPLLPCTLCSPPMS